MEENGKPQIWHALTPAGVARFATAGLFRLWSAQLAGALAAAISVIWFCAYNFSPAINTAIQQLPEDAQLSGGKLKNVPIGLLADTKFLSISASETGTEEAGIGDLQIIFCENNWKIRSMLGFMEFPYSAETISLARSQLDPWWGAWKPAIFVGIGVLVLPLLFCTWWLLSWAYCWLPRLLSFFLDRKLSWIESRHLCGAGQVSGALVAAICIVLYGMAVFDLARFLFFFSTHLIVDWIYIFLAPFFLPRISQTPTPANPFAPTGKT